MTMNSSQEEVRTVGVEDQEASPISEDSAARDEPLEEALRGLEGAAVDHNPATGEILPLRARVLRGAETLVRGDRQAEYGPPEVSFARIACEWNRHLRNTDREGELAPADVALMMARLKLARLAETPRHLDSYIDAAGYIALAAELAGAK